MERKSFQMSMRQVSWIPLKQSLVHPRHAATWCSNSHSLECSFHQGKRRRVFPRVRLATARIAIGALPLSSTVEGRKLDVCRFAASWRGFKTLCEMLREKLAQNCGLRRSQVVMALADFTIGGKPSLACYLRQRSVKLFAGCAQTKRRAQHTSRQFVGTNEVKNHFPCALHALHTCTTCRISTLRSHDSQDPYDNRAILRNTL